MVLSSVIAYLFCSKRANWFPPVQPNTKNSTKSLIERHKTEIKKKSQFRVRETEKKYYVLNKIEYQIMANRNQANKMPFGGSQHIICVTMSSKICMIKYFSSRSVVS